MGVLRCLALRFFIFCPKCLKALLFCSEPHEYASHVNWIHCFAFQVPNCTQLVTFFLFRLMPHSHESQCYPGSYGLGNKKRSSVLWDTGYWEITIRIYTVAPIKMRETSEFFLFVNVPAFWGGFVFLKVQTNVMEPLAFKRVRV